MDNTHALSILATTTKKMMDDDFDVKNKFFVCPFLHCVLGVCVCKCMRVCNIEVCKSVVAKLTCTQMWVCARNPFLDN